MEKIVNVNIFDIQVDKNKIQYPIDIPKEAKDFIELLVQKDPNLRPKPTELLKHPFFSLCPPKVKSKKLQ
jgi:serine/threonine protein kinase